MCEGDYGKAAAVQQRKMDRKRRSGRRTSDRMGKLQGNRCARITWACRRSEWGMERRTRGADERGRPRWPYEETVEEESVDSQWATVHGSDTRTNNQLQIPFNHHLKSSNYPKNSTKNIIITLRSCTLCACVPVYSTCLLRGDSLAVLAVVGCTCSSLIVIVVRCISQIQYFRQFFILRFGAQLPPPPCPVRSGK